MYIDAQHKIKKNTYYFWKLMNFYGSYERLKILISTFSLPCLIESDARLLWRHAQDQGRGRGRGRLYWVIFFFSNSQLLYDLNKKKISSISLFFIEWETFKRSPDLPAAPGIVNYFARKSWRMWKSWDGKSLPKTRKHNTDFYFISLFIHFG